VLDKITPIVLTFNETPNIGRVLDCLRWAKRVVVVDSYSNDDTEDIAKQFKNVDFLKRKFDSYSRQWNFAIKETSIITEWILALDSDYILTDEFVNELRETNPSSSISGFRAEFIYCIHGQKIRSGLYPSNIVLFKNNCGIFRQDGHAYRLDVDGQVCNMKSKILHDDRKSLKRWLESQQKYAQQESQHLHRTPFTELNWRDKIRKMRVLAPFGVFFYAYLVKGAIFEGKAGMYYAFQRMVAELILSIYLFENGLVKKKMK